MKNFIKIITVSLTAMAVTIGSGVSVDFVKGSNEALAAADAGCKGLTGKTEQIVTPTELEACGGVKTINERIYGLAKVLAGIVLGFAVVIIVYAGFKYTTSQGDPKVTEQAKMQIIAAGIGIGIAMLAFVIVNVFESLVS